MTCFTGSPHSWHSRRLTPTSTRDPCTPKKLAVCTLTFWGLVCRDLMLRLWGLWGGPEQERHSYPKKDNEEARKRTNPVAHKNTNNQHLELLLEFVRLFQLYETVYERCVHCPPIEMRAELSSAHFRQRPRRFGKRMIQPCKLRLGRRPPAVFGEPAVPNAYLDREEDGSSQEVKDVYAVCERGAQS